MAFEIRYYTMLIYNKDDIEFVTEFPCFLGHPVLNVAPFLRFFFLICRAFTSLANLTIYGKILFFAAAVS